MQKRRPLITKTVLVMRSAKGRSHGSIEKTFILTMKLTVFLLTAAFLQVSAKGLSQTVTFSGQHVTLHQVFSAVKKQTGYAVMYKADLLDKLAPASISATNVPLERFLGQVLRDQQLDFSIKNTTIFIFRKAADPSSGQPGSNGTADHSL